MGLIEARAWKSTVYVDLWLW